MPNKNLIDMAVEFSKDVNNHIYEDAGMPIESTLCNDLIETCLSFLNNLVKIDNAAIEKLIEARIPCNQTMLDHPTVQAGVYDNIPKVGMLGIINGLIGIQPKGSKKPGWGYIAAQFDDNEKLIGFVTLPS